MDEEAAIRAHRVAAAAAAWISAPQDHLAYQRLVEASAAWSEYESPRLELDAADGDLVDEVLSERMPVPLSQALVGVGEGLRAQARKRIGADSTA